MEDREQINGPRFTILAGTSVVITPNHKPQAAYSYQTNKVTYFHSVSDRVEPDHLVFRSKGWTIRVHERDVIRRPVIDSLAFALEGGEKVVAAVDQHGACKEILPYHDGPAQAGKTMLDVTTGDQVWMRGKVCRVMAVYVNKSYPATDENVPVHSGRTFLEAATSRS